MAWNPTMPAYFLTYWQENLNVHVHEAIIKQLMTLPTHTPKKSAITDMVRNRSKEGGHFG